MGSLIQGWAGAGAGTWALAPAGTIAEAGAVPMAGAGAELYLAIWLWL